MKDLEQLSLIDYIDSLAEEKITQEEKVISREFYYIKSRRMPLDVKVEKLESLNGRLVGLNRQIKSSKKRLMIENTRLIRLVKEIQSEQLEEFNTGREYSEASKVQSPTEDKVKTDFENFRLESVNTKRKLEELLDNQQKKISHLEELNQNLLKESKAKKNNHQNSEQTLNIFSEKVLDLISSLKDKKLNPLIESQLKIESALPGDQYEILCALEREIKVCLKDLNQLSSYNQHIYTSSLEALKNLQSEIEKDCKE